MFCFHLRLTFLSVLHTLLRRPTTGLWFRTSPLLRKKTIPAAIPRLRLCITATSTLAATTDPHAQWCGQYIRTTRTNEPAVCEALRGLLPGHAAAVPGCSSSCTAVGRRPREILCHSAKRGFACCFTSHWGQPSICRSDRRLPAAIAVSPESAGSGHCERHCVSGDRR